MTDDKALTAPAFLSGGGECGGLIARLDWSATPLGPIARWPQSLRTATSILLRSRVPMALLWGPEGVLIYNDGYAVIAGGRHPDLLGSGVREGWPEITDFNDHVMRSVLAGETLAYRDQELTLRREDAPERIWFDLDYSPVLDEEGRPAGVLAVVVETTERVRAEARLRENEAELRMVADALPVLVSYIDREGRYRFVNGAYERWFGLPRGRILGLHLRDLLGEEGYARIEPLAGRALAGERVGYSHQGARSHAGERDIEATYLPRFDPDGSVQGFYVLVIDVTERRAAEERLREAGEKAAAEAAERAAILGQLGEGVILTDAEGRITFVNEAAERLHGATLLGIGPDDYTESYSLLTEDGRPHPPRELPLARAVLDGETVTDARWRIRRPDGTEVVAVGSAQPYRDPRGRQIGAVLAMRDDTARAAAEAALRRLNAELEARVAEALAERRVLADIVERTDAMIQVLDHEFRFVAINKASVDEYEGIYGVRPRVGDRLLDLIPEGALRDEVRAVWARALAGEDFTLEAEFGDPALGRRWYDLRYRTLRGAADQGDIAYLFGFDVTERVRERERLAQAEDQLRQAQKMEAVGQLTGGIAHDFNNVLGAVVGSLDLIRRRPDDLERVKRYAEAALKAAERGAKLTGQLLAFSRAQRLELKPLVVADLVEGMRDLLERTLGAVVRLRFDLDDGRVPVLSDATQLEMAVLNLAINARDAMPQGGDLLIGTATRRIEGDPELADGEHVEICVTDTGGGMPPEVAARAFDPFFTTKGVGKGTGLGLSQVYGVARQAGGTVRIDSRPGEGTTVRILLPRTGAAARPPADAGADGPAADGRSATVLVVDDDPDVRRVLVDLLDALGYRVMEAEDGPAGLRVLDEARPDLLMVDFAMPGMNGAEVARAARERRPDLPVVFASGYSDTAAIEAAAGPDAPVLRKPFRIGDLQAVLAGVLSGREA